MENISPDNTEFPPAWLAAAQKQDGVLAKWMLGGAAEQKPLILSIFAYSPYLSRLLCQYPDVLHDMVFLGPDETYNRIAARLAPTEKTADDYADLMKSLRIGKGRTALLVALADMAELWPLEKVTGALSDIAERSLKLALDEILLASYRRKEIELLHPETPTLESGIIVLGMGKLGGRELNYSSDIDLIIFYEPERIPYKGKRNEQQFMNRVSHDLVSIMQERTAQGYVFRTDLRLRPDPSSTPPAVTTDAAYYYYESVGQNWERAAMIKARPVAGDMEAAERFMKSIAPFMWRRNLDFAAINDIHSIKRQMDSLNSKAIRIAGHNIKVGMGGIREIEFYVQIHQLIWGGREPSLRIKATCETLAKLMDMGLIEPEKEALLKEAYVYFRKVEHRLQMVNDEQTHSMPDTPEGIAHIAHFMGYQDVAAFEKDLLGYLNKVHAIYASSFKGDAEHLGDQGNLVFTGVSHDPDTLQTLRNLGYTNPETVSEIVMGWHHGSKRATRTKRARELLTEMMPLLLKRLGETAHPDAAFLKFNDFLTNLPSGVQLFSVFSANPHLLDLIAHIMGSAPTLAESLSKNPELLDAVLYEDFYGPLPSLAQMDDQLNELLKNCEDFEERMERLRHFRNEKQFQAGVQLLEQMINARQAGRFLSSLAEAIVNRTLSLALDNFCQTYGKIPDARFAIIALGKLGSKEMTFSSDIDLVFIYDADFTIPSDGEKSFSASVYYNRFVQRLLNALSAMGRGGRLYEVDTRLRPSGNQGLLAVSIKALSHYFSELAWTFEYMAFTKARAIAGDETLKQELDDFICSQLSKPRDRAKLKTDVIDMRERIEKEHGSKNPWDIKYVRGGLMDIDFIAQYLMLYHAPDTPGAQAGSAAENFDWLARSGRMDKKTAESLVEADQFLGQIFNMLRLCCDRRFDEEGAPQGLKKLLVESVKEKDFESLKARLIQVEQSVHGQYITLLPS